MKSSKLITAAIVAAFVCVPIQFVNAESPQGHRSQKRPLRVAWNDAWDDDDHDDRDDDDKRQGNRDRKQYDNRRVRLRDNLHEIDDNQSVRSPDDVNHARHQISEHSFEAQRRYEEKELVRQVDRAAHLRQINEQTGNQQLIDIADRLEQRALEHYKQQLDRINEQERRTQPPATLATEQNAPADAPADAPLVSILKSRTTTANSPPPTTADSSRSTFASTPQPQPTRANPTRTSDHLSQQLVKEQKVLQQRLDAANRLREVHNGPNGNERLSESADRMEQRAWERFEQRVQQFIDPPTNQPQHDQHYVTDDVEHSLDEPEPVVRKVDIRWVPKKPVRRMFKGLRRVLGR